MHIEQDGALAVYTHDSSTYEMFAKKTAYCPISLADHKIRIDQEGKGESVYGAKSAMAMSICMINAIHRQTRISKLCPIITD